MQLLRQKPLAGIVVEHTGSMSAKIQAGDPLIHCHSDQLHAQSPTPQEHGGDVDEPTARLENGPKEPSPSLPHCPTLEHKVSDAQER